MTQQVILEDGSIHEFPDDASQYEMMNTLPQAQYAGALRGPAIAASGLTKGFIGMTSLPGEAGAAYDKFIGQPFAKAVTGQTPSFGLKDFLGGTAAENIQRGRQAGFIDNPAIQPQNEGEKLVEAAGAGIGGNLPLAAVTGGASIIPQSISAAGAGAGAKGLQDLWPDNWLGKETVAPLLGGFAGGNLAAGATDLVSKGINAIKGVSSPIVDAYDKLGIKPRLAGDITGDRNIQMLQATGAEMPLGAQMVKNASDKTLGEFGNAVEKTASKLGNSVTLQEAGGALQNEGNKWLQNFKLQSQKQWNGVDNMVGNTTVPLNGTKQAIADITSPAQGNPVIAAFLKSPIAKQFISILKMSPSGQVPWETARALKTRIGEYLANPELVADAGGAQAKMLYAALSNDMKSSLSGNPAALAKFEQANTFTTKGHEFIDNFLSNISGKGISPEQAATYALNSGVRGGTTLQALRQELPEGVNELAAATVRRSAMAQPGAQNASGNAVSPNTWLNNYDPTRRMAPEAFGALFPNPEIQARMSALDTVAGTMRKSAELASKSHSALPFTTTAALSAPVVAGVHGLMEGGIGHGIRDFLLGGVPLGMGTGAGAITTNEALTRFLATPGTNVPFGWNPSIAAGAYGGSR